jgi:hypothetical protein|tara:strand:- start:4065 stop:5222 length:1158 start_codon:yes stop_codon:yes gene_type:complete
MNIPIWDGSSSFAPGETPFGFYDNDAEFRRDADKVAVFCANRMGYPLVDIELQSGSFYTAFEEAVTMYGNEIWAYIVRDNFLDLEGLSIFEELNETIITPSFASIVRLTEQYADEAGVGGNIPWYSGSFALTRGQQNYSFETFMSASGFTGSAYSEGIEIKRVFYQEPVPASSQFLDPYSGWGFGGGIAAGMAGVGGFGGSQGFLMMPLSFDMQVIQSIEMNQMVRRSNYSFEVHGNDLKVFPVPNQSGAIWFQYIFNSDRSSGAIKCAEDKINNVSNANFKNPKYSLINSIGRQWIFEMTLAICKEMLGYVRGKYSSIPIPNAEVNLNQGDLISAATAEKTALLERLRAYLDETSRAALLGRKALEAESKMVELQQVPWTIFIG